MQDRKAWLAVLVAVMCGPASASAQVPVPGLPSAPGVPGLGGAGVPAAAPAAAAPKSIWSGLGLSGANLQACRAKLCASPFGSMLNSFTGGPMGALTGGFLPPICPPAPSAAQIAALQQQPGGAAAAAAAIKASEADAKARVAAVEYLGTVDCSRWPEARKALIYSLREDPNECVRLAAARALNSGCCCNKEVMEALRVCVSGEAKGNAPAETSARVKAAAFCALQNCLLRVPEDLPAEIPPEASPPPGPAAPPVPLERSAQAGPEPTHLAVRYSPPGRRGSAVAGSSPPRTFAQTVDDARRTMFATAAAPRPSALLPTGQRSVLGAFAKARRDRAGEAWRREREQVASNPEEHPAPVLAADRSSLARRGLFGVLLSSWGR